MDNTKLREIIQNKNEQRERHVVKTAEEIVEGIIREQQAIVASQSRIQALRKDLADLQVDELDPTTILGDV